MVVTSAEQQPSVRKTRRKQTKKSAPRTADTDIPPDSDDENAIPAASTSQPASSNPPPPPPDDDELMIDVDPPSFPVSSAPAFAPLPAGAGKSALKSESRRIAIPPHRMTPLKKEWVNVFGPLTEILGLQVRMNVQRKCVEARVRDLYIPTSTV
jgi:RNA-binding protein PNO1